MMETRVVLLKPGDVLLVGNAGDTDPERFVGIHDAFPHNRVLVFADDIDIASMTVEHALVLWRDARPDHYTTPRRRDVSDLQMRNEYMDGPSEWAREQVEIMEHVQSAREAVRDAPQA